MLVYLAAPYSHPDPTVMYERAHEVTTVSAKIIAKYKVQVFSAITMGHAFVETCYNIPTTWEFWEEMNKRILQQCCDGLLVLSLPGWGESKGVQAEIKLAKEVGLWMICFNINEIDLLAPYLTNEKETK